MSDGGSDGVADGGSSGGSGRTTAGAVLDLLAGQGVTLAFGLPGVHNLAFWDALAPGRPAIVGVRHEQTAAYAADGLARTTGGLGVALTTTGPGAANAVAAFGEAAASGSPVLLIASEVSTALRRPGSVRGILHESSDQAALFAPLAKAVYRPETPLAAVESVARAVTTAMAFPRGPVYVGIPVDVLGAVIDDDVPLPSPRHAPVESPATADVDAALELIASSRRPLVWAGGGAVASGAADAVAALAGRLGAPVITSYAARGLLASAHPLLVDAPPHEPEVDELVASADLMIALGTGFDGMTTRNWKQPMPERLLAVNIDPAHIDRAWPATVGVVGDVRRTCDALAVRMRQRDVWADSVYLIGPAIRTRLAADTRTREATDLLAAIDAAWPDDGPLVCDMAVAGYWVGGYAARREPRRLQYPVGWGTLGYALPAAVGAACAGAGPVLAVCGDGGVVMALGELATLAQERLPVTVLVVDDGGYGMLRYDQQVFGHDERGVDLVGPDWIGVAAAFGIPAEEAAGAGEPLRVALAEATAAGGPRLVLLRATLFPPRTTSPRWNES